MNVVQQEIVGEFLRVASPCALNMAQNSKENECSPKKVSLQSNGYEPQKLNRNTMSRSTRALNIRGGGCVLRGCGFLEHLVGQCVT